MPVGTGCDVAKDQTIHQDKNLAFEKILTIK